MQRPLPASTLALALAALGGCASIAGRTHYPVAVGSSPAGAAFVVADQAGREVRRGTTPQTVTLKSGAGYFDGERYSVTYYKSGYFDGFATIDSGVSGFYLGNVLFGGLPGLLIVDPATGAMWSLPPAVSATLQKLPPGF
jgi:hypothetical protein